MGANRFAELGRCTYLVVKSSFDIGFFGSLRIVSIAFTVFFDTFALAYKIASVNNDSGKDQNRGQDDEESDLCSADRTVRGNQVETVFLSWSFVESHIAVTFQALFDFLDVMLGPERIEQVGQAFVRERNRWLRDLAKQGWS